MAITEQSAPQEAGGILLVDDHELIRLGFRALVESGRMPQEAMPNVFEAASLTQAMALYEQRGSTIAVVVLDLALPDANGLDGLMTFRQHFPEAAVVVLSGTENTAAAQHALALGAIAFFPKSGDLGDMVEFVRHCALHGAKAITQQQAESLTAAITAENDNGLASLAGVALTARQLQILRWLLEGRSNRDISQLACLSEGTVKNHVSMLLLSFNVRSRAQLISKLRT